MRHDIDTPEAFCWLYAAGCLDAREQEAAAHGEHHISKGYFDHLHECVRDGRKPSDDVIRRIFRRPFEVLGDSCYLEDMVQYWRVTHQDPSENTPVYRVHIVPYTKKMYPRVDREGVWWESYFYNPKTQEFEHRLLHNVHDYALRTGMRVYIHGLAIAEIAD